MIARVDTKIHSVSRKRPIFNVNNSNHSVSVSSDRPESLAVSTILAAIPISTAVRPMIRFSKRVCFQDSKLCVRISGHAPEDRKVSSHRLQHTCRPAARNGLVYANTIPVAPLDTRILPPTGDGSMKEDNSSHRRIRPR